MGRLTISLLSLYLFICLCMGTQLNKKELTKHKKKTTKNLMTQNS